MSVRVLMGGARLKVEKNMSGYVLVDSDMRIIPEVLDFANTMTYKGMSPNTVKSYLDDLKRYYEWLNLEGMEFYEVRPYNITSFVEHIDKQHTAGRVSPATLNRYLATLSAFYRHFEVVNGFVIESPMVKVKGYMPSVNRGYLRHVTKNWDKGLHNYFRRKNKKKVDRKNIDSKTASIFYNTFEKICGGDESLLFRNKLMFRLLYETGFRISELLHLRINDFDYPEPMKKTGNIYLIERPNEPLDRQLKSGERTTPVSANLLQALDDYILFHRPQKGEIDYIFVSHANSNLGEPISRSSVEKMFNDLKAASGDDYYRLTPHALRHTHASELQAMGVDINIIKERLGHKSIMTTSQYAKPTVQTLTIAHERYLENKKGVFADE